MTGKANRLPYFFLGGPDCRYSVMIGTAGAGGGPLRSESARRLTPEIRQSKFPGTPRPSVTLALAAPGPPVQLCWTTLSVARCESARRPNAEIPHHSPLPRPGHIHGLGTTHHPATKVQTAKSLSRYVAPSMSLTRWDRSETHSPTSPSEISPQRPVSP